VKVPFIVPPFCASCQVPVDEYWLSLARDGSVVIQVQCHGKTQSIPLTMAQVLDTPNVICFLRHQGFDGTNIIETQRTMKAK